MTGVQTLVPVMLDHVAAARLTLQRFVDLTSAGPARLFGVAGKGRIAAGYDADLTVVDLKRRKPSTTRGSPRTPTGPPMTARSSPAGRSAPWCAGAGSCGRANSRRPRRAKRCAFLTGRVTG